MSTTITTYNILFDTRDNDLPEEHRWPSRKERLTQAIERLDSDILCVQEMKPRQRNDLLSALGQIYICFGAAYENSMSNAIFFKKDRFKPIDSAVIPAGKNNHITYLKLRDLQSGKDFSLLNTHLNFASEQLRSDQARLLNALAHALLSGAPTTPLIITGDMNTFPNRPDLPLPFYDGDSIEEIIKGDLLSDSRDVSQSAPKGPASSYTNSGPDDATPFMGTGVDGVILDHIFVSKGVEVITSEISTLQIDGEFPSDHLPLKISVNIA